MKILGMFFEPLTPFKTVLLICVGTEPNYVIQGLSIFTAERGQSEKDVV